MQGGDRSGQKLHLHAAHLGREAIQGLGATAGGNGLGAPVAPQPEIAQVGGLDPGCGQEPLAKVQRRGGVKEEVAADLQAQEFVGELGGMDRCLVALQQQAPPFGSWVPAFALHREFGQGGQARFGVFAHGTIDKAAPAGRPAAQGLLRRIQNRLEGLSMAASLH